MKLDEQDQLGRDGGGSSFYDDILYFNDAAYLTRLIEGNLSDRDLVGKVILDFGCGAGDASAIFAEKGAGSVLAVDIGKKNIMNGRAAHAKYKNLTFSRQDLNHFELGEACYDLIWSDTVIELLNRAPEDIAQDLFSALRQGGVIYISLTEKTYFNVFLFAVLKLLNKPLMRPFKMLIRLLAILRYKISGTDIDSDNFENKIKYLSIPHINLLSRKQVSGILEQVGFRIVYVRDRIKSDPNSPPHFEIRAERPLSGDS